MSEVLENTVSSTETPEAVLAEVMTPEKKAELIEKLGKLKQTLDSVENKMIQNQLASGKITIDEMRHIVQVLSHINSDLRSNVAMISEVGSGESRREKIEKALGIMHKTSTIYEGLIGQLVLL